MSQCNVNIMSCEIHHIAINVSNSFSCYSIFLKWTILALNFHSQTHVDTFLFVKFHTSFFFVLKIEDFFSLLQNYKRLYLQLCHNFFIMLYSCLFLFYYYFFTFFFFSSHSSFSEQLKQQFMTIIIHYMNIFFYFIFYCSHLRVYNSMQY